VKDRYSMIAVSFLRFHLIGKRLVANGFKVERRIVLERAPCSEYAGIYHAPRVDKSRTGCRKVSGLDQKSAMRDKDRRRTVAQRAARVSVDPGRIVEAWQISKDGRSNARHGDIVRWSDGAGTHRAHTTARRRHSIGIRGAAVTVVVAVIVGRLFGGWLGQQSARAPAWRQKQRQTGQE